MIHHTLQVNKMSIGAKNARVRVMPEDLICILLFRRKFRTVSMKAWNWDNEVLHEIR